MESYSTKKEQLFRVLKHIDGDGYGSICLVHHDYLGVVAFKTIRDDSETSLAELKAEADIHRNIRHPNIVIFYEELFSLNVNGFFIEHIKYGSVEQFSKQFAVSHEWRIQILYDTALAMCFLHRKELPIIHGSVSYQNILIGLGYRAKVSDFGLACILPKGYSETEIQTRLIGNTKYTAPEYFSNPVRRKSVKFDVYSFAILAWEIMSQKQAYSDLNDMLIKIFVRQGKRLSMEDINFSISSPITQLIEDCWRENENERPTFETIKDILFDHISGIQCELKRSYASLVEQERVHEFTNTLTVLLQVNTAANSEENISTDATCKEIQSGKIQLLEAIGHGGYSNVYRANYVEDGDFGFGNLERRVAYKKFKIEFIRHSDLEDLKNEAKVHCRLKHENIIKCLGMISEPGNYGLIFELAEYGEARNYLIKNSDFIIKLSMINDVAIGMNYLHSLKPNPVIHGDLKIQNVLVGLGEDSKSIVAKLCDFGFSRLKDYSQSRSVKEVRLGTITHIPPEYWNDNTLRKNEKFDVYSFGICAWEMISLERPYQNANNNPGIIQNWVSNGQRPLLSFIKSKAPEWMVELITDCWARAAGKRPSFEIIVILLSKYTKTG